MEQPHLAKTRLLPPAPGPHAGGRVSLLGEAQKPPERGPGQPAVGGPARAGWMDPLLGLTDPAVPPASTILRLPRLLFSDIPGPSPGTAQPSPGQRKL